MSMLPPLASARAAQQTLRRILLDPHGFPYSSLMPGELGQPMGEWIAFWNSEHSIYVNARHRDVHYRVIAADISALVPAGGRVLDYGCGEALHADLISSSAGELTLCEAAPLVRAALSQRFDAHPRIHALSPEEVAALPAASFDAIVMHSVAQYLTPQEFDALLADFHR